jgi:nicotinamide riboside transporter PnuC
MAKELAHMSQKTADLIRKIAIVLFGLAVAFTLLGGLGNTCVAFNAEKYGKAFEKFISYRSEYQMMVYVGIATALVGILALWGMVKGKKWAYLLGLVVLLIGVAAALTQMYYTSTIKQVSFFKTPPTSMRLYTTLLALIVLLIVRLPGIWKYVDFTKTSSKRSAGPAAGLTACAMGILTVTTPLWAGASHMVDGYNLVNVLEWPLLLGGGAMIVAGLATLVWSRAGAPARQMITRLLHARA